MVNGPPRWGFAVPPLSLHIHCFSQCSNDIIGMSIAAGSDSPENGYEPFCPKGAPMPSVVRTPHGEVVSVDENACVCVRAAGVVMGSPPMDMSAGAPRGNPTTMRPTVPVAGFHPDGQASSSK